MNGRSLIFSILFVFSELKCDDTDENDQHGTIYQFQAKNIDGKMVSMEKYRDKVVLFTNVASYCGYTDSNYNAFKELDGIYREKGFRVAAFPCNQFEKQEPETEGKILDFVKSSYTYAPDMYSKIEVNGQNTHPLWKFLKKERGSSLSADIPWNFSKFLVDKNGHVVGRYSHSVNPIDLEEEISRLLNS
ncbi:Glutathione peroxidase [Caenorhabditis elegans]|uniref:Glutathione peroxidase n=1 Tax=Caenorhabditis elegans TaxID=6239 RepID=H2KYJ6_CAEEL|nr:Glutathione peroxidase [Caenorhabditis elegans]CCD63560.1 Glutathione peroxidase [Caenorhabditis elegans]|eukprot:NP_001023368.1 Glutathione peroxidase [Caenorhabditis elegans]